MKFYRPAMLHDDVAYLPIGEFAERGVVVVDAQDAWLEKYSMVLHNAGYAKVCIGGKEVLLHHVLLTVPKGKTIDHINGNKLDNRRSNLRVCTLRSNNLNRPQRSHSKQAYKGVEFMPKLNKYRARIRLNGKRHSLGCYITAEEAHKAYAAKARELFGEYAYGATT